MFRVSYGNVLFQLLTEFASAPITPQARLPHLRFSPFARGPSGVARQRRVARKARAVARAKRLRHA